MRRFLATLAVGALAAWSASASEIDALKGRYGFDWLVDLAKSKCVKIDDKLIKTFSSPSYVCDLAPDATTASSGVAFKCKRKDGNSEYLIFHTLAACRKEHETQSNNAE